MSRLSLCFVVMMAVCANGASAGAAEYTITALEPLPGGLDTIATAINERGQVVGHSRLDRSENVGRSRPVIWDKTGRPTELWPENGSFTLGGIPLGINDAGQIVGRYGAGSGVPLPGPGVRPGRGFIWDAVHGLHDLGSLGGPNVEATGINSVGQVVGSSVLASFSGEHAFVWDLNNGMRDIGTLGGVASYGAAINDVGEIVGTSYTDQFAERGFSWSLDGGMRQLPSPSGGVTRAVALNDHGEILGVDWGTRTLPGGMVIWRLDGNLFVPVESGTSLQPFDLNNREKVVGYIGAPGESELEAFFWDSANGFINLESLFEDSRWDLQEARAINDEGQIIGVGHFNGTVRGFLMTPIPEPSSLALVAAVLIAAICWRRSIAAIVTGDPLRN